MLRTIWVVPTLCRSCFRWRKPRPALKQYLASRQNPSLIHPLIYSALDSGRYEPSQTLTGVPPSAVTLGAPRFCVISAWRKLHLNHRLTIEVAVTKLRVKNEGIRKNPSSKY